MIRQSSNCFLGDGQINSMSSTVEHIKTLYILPSLQDFCSFLSYHDYSIILKNFILIFQFSGSLHKNKLTLHNLIMFDRNVCCT